MFLKLVFDDQIVKKLAMHDHLKSLGNLKTLIAKLKGWQVGDFDLEVKNPYGRFSILRDDTDLLDFLEANERSTFIDVYVIKRESPAPGLAVGEDSRFMEFMPQSARHETKATWALEIPQQRAEQGEAKVEDLVASYFENVGQELTAQMRSLHLASDNQNRRTGSGDAEIVKEIIIDDELIDPTPHGSGMQHPNAEDSFNRHSFKEKGKLGRKKQPALKLKRKEITNQTDAEQKGKREPQIHKRIRKLKNQVGESEKRTREHIDDRFKQLEERISELTNLLTTNTQTTGARQSQPSSIHYNVECDVCGIAPIVGRRFNCTVCSNYDLCERCEASTAHSHPMLRLASSPDRNVIDISGQGQSNRTPGPQVIDLTPRRSAQHSGQPRVQTMTIENTSDSAEQRRSKLELLDFMFGKTITDERKEELVESYADTDITSFCRAMQDLTN